MHSEKVAGAYALNKSHLSFCTGVQSFALSLALRSVAKLWIGFNLPLEDL